jgi:small subunit ribosomal protein S6
MIDYELALVLDPGLKKDDKEALVVRVESWVKKGKGKVEKVKDWGMRDLAYPINKRHEALYLLMEVSSEGNLEKELQEKVGLEDKIYRYLLVRKALKQKKIKKGIKKK